jgi:hypothetical protein
VALNEMNLQRGGTTLPTTQLAAPGPAASNAAQQQQQQQQQQQPPAAHQRGLPFDEEAKLVYGVVMSLRHMIKKLSGR